jgi:hypothetical protein
MANGFALSAYEMDLNDAEARVRDDHNSCVEAARGAIAECLRQVKIQAKGATGDWSELIARLEELPEALPEIRQ